MIKCVGKRGDTLIEVMLAVGIFSMVAVAVVAVMSGGTSSAQTALETTLTREEIDAQAEALRFIHSAYIADKSSGTEGKFSNLWKKITERAIELENRSDVESIVQYTPSSCQELYNNSNVSYQKAFVIDTKKLNNPSPSDIVVPSSDSIFSEASTYPHLVYSNDNANLVDSNTSSSFIQAEGLYIVAVRDPDSTLIVGSDKASGREAAYFDFYIRSCWYGTGDQNPSTISTVMRLYDPDAIKQLGGYILKFEDVREGNSIYQYEKPTEIQQNPAFVPAGESFKFPRGEGVRYWCNRKPNVIIGKECKIPGEELKVPLETFSREAFSWYAVYNDNNYIWIDVNTYAIDNPLSPPSSPSDAVSGGVDGINVKVWIDNSRVPGTENWLCTNSEMTIIDTPKSTPEGKKCLKTEVQDPDSPDDKTKTIEVQLEHLKVVDNPGDFWRPVREGSTVKIVIESSSYSYYEYLFGGFKEFCDKLKDREEECSISGNTITLEFTAEESLKRYYSTSLGSPVIDIRPYFVSE